MMMASMTIRNLDDDIMALLRVRASLNGRSMEEEARRVLADAVEREIAPGNALGTAIHKLFQPFSDIELELPAREPPGFE
jgi:plasmid stability protein